MSKRKRINRRRVIAFFMVVGFGLAMAIMSTLQTQSAPVAKKKIRWKMASTFPGTLPILGTSGVYLSKRIEEVSGSRIKIKFFDPNKLVPPLQVFESVSTGAVNTGWSAPGYWIGKIPASPLFSAVPFGPDTSEYLAWIYQGGGVELWRELYGRHNVVPVPCAVLPPEASGWFREPITRIEQFKGMKIRFYGIGGKVLQKLGASVQLLAGGDIFLALERGVLDATEFSMPAIDEKLGFYQVAKHYYFPVWHQQSSILELIVNQRKWDSLDKGEQALIDSVCRDVIVRTMTEGETLQGSALKRMKSKGVQIHTWPPKILKSLKKTTGEVLKEESAKDADFARVLKSLQDFRAQYAEWKDISRLKD